MACKVYVEINIWLTSLARTWDQEVKSSQDQVDSPSRPKLILALTFFLSWKCNLTCKHQSNLKDLYYLYIFHTRIHKEKYVKLYSVVRWRTISIKLLFFYCDSPINTQPNTITKFSHQTLWPFTVLYITAACPGLSTQRQTNSWEGCGEQYTHVLNKSTAETQWAGNAPYL